MLKKATKHKTVTAATFEEGDVSGISIGTYFDGAAATIEDREDGIVILLNDYKLERMGIRVLHTDADWNVIREEEY